MQLIASKTRAERASAAAWHRAEPRGSAVLHALSLEWLGCKPRFNEASVLRWLFFVPVHMLPSWQEPWLSGSVCTRKSCTGSAALTICL